jgi:hypothetical protein
LVTWLNSHRKETGNEGSSKMKQFIYPLIFALTFQALTATGETYQNFGKG